MKQVKKLIGVIDSMKGSEIRTRFFYFDQETGEVQDVTHELCEAINQYNEVAHEIRRTGKYSMVIPYEYGYGLANYSFGCGLAHYLQEDVFEEVEKRTAQAGNPLVFPLKECRISMFVPSDVKHILKCKGAFDGNMMNSLKEYYGNIML